MTDRELLELAAKAAGIKIHEKDSEPPEGFESRGWNPLMYDGDALRLAVKLTMVIACYEDSCEIENLNGESLAYEVNADPYAATRRAIVRAAAEIGKVME